MLVCSATYALHTAAACCTQEKNWQMKANLTFPFPPSSFLAFSLKAGSDLSHWFANTCCFQNLIWQRVNKSEECPSALNMSRPHTQYLLFFVYLTLRCLRAATAYLIVNSRQGETCSDSVRWLICPGINLFVQRSSHTLVTQQRLCLLHRWLFHHTPCPAISSVFNLLFIFFISPSLLFLLLLLLYLST